MQERQERSLTTFQKDLWMEDKASPESCAYSIQRIFEIPDHLDSEAFQTHAISISTIQHMRLSEKSKG
jgi:hypothetical protein